MLEGRPIRDPREARYLCVLPSPLYNVLVAAVGAVALRMEYEHFVPDGNKAVTHRPTSRRLVEKFFVCGAVTRGNWALDADCLVDDRNTAQTRVVVMARVGKHYNCPQHWECTLDRNYQVLSLKEVEPPPADPPNPPLWLL